MSDLSRIPVYFAVTRRFYPVQRLLNSPYTKLNGCLFIIETKIVKDLSRYFEYEQTNNLKVAVFAYRYR